MTQKKKPTKKAPLSPRGRKTEARLPHIRTLADRIDHIDVDVEDLQEKVKENELRDLNTAAAYRSLAGSVAQNRERGEKLLGVLQERYDNLLEKLDALAERVVKLEAVGTDK